MTRSSYEAKWIVGAPCDPRTRTLWRRFPADRRLADCGRSSPEGTCSPLTLRGVRTTLGIMTAFFLCRPDCRSTVTRPAQAGGDHTVHLFKSRSHCSHSTTTTLLFFHAHLQTSRSCHVAAKQRNTINCQSSGNIHALKQICLIWLQTSHSLSFYDTCASRASRR